jgi:hypothetical protein
MKPPAAAASRPPPPDAGPSEKEKAQRAENLRRNRELLLAKKTQERQKQLEKYEQQNPVPPVAQPVQRTNMVAELTMATPPPVAEDEKEKKPQAMRLALTRQLKQSLLSSGTGAQLDEQLGRLESIRR